MKSCVGPCWLFRLSTSRPEDDAQLSWGQQVVRPKAKHAARPIHLYGDELTADLDHDASQDGPGGLLAGRVLSLILDGQPAPLLTFYAVLEFVIIPVAWWVYARPDSSSR